MATSTKPPSDDIDRQWFIIGRWQEYEGEARANLLRIIGIAAFYIVELVNYYGLNLGFVEMPKQVDLPFHQAITALALGWAVIALGIHVCLTQRIFPAILKYLSTGCDIVLLTAIVMVADGPRSPLIVDYLLIIILTTLRFNLSLIRFAAVGSMAGCSAMRNGLPAMICACRVTRQFGPPGARNSRRPFPGGEFLDEFSRIWRFPGGRPPIGLTSPGRQFRLRAAPFRLTVRRGLDLERLPRGAYEFAPPIVIL